MDHIIDETGITVNWLLDNPYGIKFGLMQVQVLHIICNRHACNITWRYNEGGSVALERNLYKI